MVLLDRAIGRYREDPQRQREPGGTDRMM